MSLGRKVKEENALQDTFIGGSAVITGDIISEKSLRIDGKLMGNVQASHRIVIGESGYVKGNLKAESIILYGKIEGNIEAKELLEIMNTGKLIGDVKVKGFTIQTGGVFCGNSQMSIEESKVVDLSKSAK